MAIFDIKLPNRMAKALRLANGDVCKHQLRILKKLVHKARFTEFCQKYHFANILMEPDTVKDFQQTVTINNYYTIYKQS